MLTYKNHLKELVLPEYGRNIQNMVDYCLTIEDRAERTRCARSIVDAMTILFPTQGDQQAYRRKLWDHVAVISGFKLDVDLPFELVHPEALNSKPGELKHDTPEPRRRHYGHLVESMITKAAGMPEGEERDELVYLIADHMKKLLMAVNPEGVDDVKVYKDLYDMSEGVLYLSPDTTTLHEFTIAQQPGGKKKRKK